MHCIAPLLTLRQIEEPATRASGGGLPKGAIMLGVLVLVYLLPAMLALAGGKRRRWKIVAINVLAGWTIIGWIAAMLMTWAYEAPPADDAAAPPKGASGRDRED